MDRGDEHEPWNINRVFHRVPVPIAAEAEGLVGPVASHKNTRSENCSTHQCPRQGRFDPFGVFLLPKPGDAECKRHSCQSEAKKQCGGVNYHPIVLQKGIETISVFRDEISLDLKDRIGHGVAKEDKGRTAHFDVEPRDDDT